MATVTERPPQVTAPAPPKRIPGQPGRFARYEALAIGTVSVLLFLVIWQLVASARVVQPLFLPGPSDIIAAYAGLIRGGTLANDLWTSGQALLVGFGLAIALGLPLGMLMGWYTRLNYALDPFVSVLYSTPRIALVPLLILWLGIGVAPIIAIVFLGAFFPIVINTVAGMRNLDPSLIKAARSFGASDMQLFRTVALPGSVPFILAGLRLGVGHALIGVVVGELIAAQAGIGHMMATAGATFQTARVFAGLFIVAGAGLVLTSIIARFEQRFQAWRPSRPA
jgi:NitT/TauT family transport system permease protein